MRQTVFNSGNGPKMFSQQSNLVFTGDLSTHNQLPPSCESVKSIQDTSQFSSLLFVRLFARKFWRSKLDETLIYIQSDLFLKILHAV